MIFLFALHQSTINEDTTAMDSKDVLLCIVDIADNDNSAAGETAGNKHTAPNNETRYR